MTNFPSIFDEKKAARQIFKRMRSELLENERQPLDLALFTHLVNCEAFKSAHTVLCYYSVKGEPNTLSIAEYALRLGKKVAFPVSHKESKRLTFHYVSALSDLTEGTYGILEPSLDSPSPDKTDKAICIVPALAFDKSGKRLGYGGGYYDRFLSDFQGIAIGLAYDSFLVDKIPTDEYDATMNIIITEKGEVFFSE